MKKKTNLLILTTARERAKDPWEYCNDTIWQIQEQDTRAIQQFGIVCDGKYGGIRPEGWGIYEYSKGTAVGNKFPFWQLLNTGADMGGDLLALEDDLLFSAGAIARMAKVSVPYDCGWIQFFAPKTASAATGLGLWKQPCGSSRFNQALKFDHGALISLTGSALPPEWFAETAADNALGLAAKSLGLQYVRHYPDLCEHVGTVSQAHDIVGLKNFRKAQNFRGEDWNCNKLDDQQYAEVKQLAAP